MASVLQPLQHRQMGMRCNVCLSRSTEVHKNEERPFVKLVSYGESSIASTTAALMKMQW